MVSTKRIAKAACLTALLVTACAVRLAGVWQSPGTAPPAAVVTRCQEPGCSNTDLAKWSVCRIPSHGVSGVVIASEGGDSWILTCAHGFLNGGDRRRVTVNLPSPNPGAAVQGATTLVAVDYRRDLALVHVRGFRARYIAPVRNVSPRHGHPVLSVGFKGMAFPPVEQRGAIVGAERTSHSGHDFLSWLTSPPPREGQSGGALIDSQTGCLLGVTHGYRNDPKYGQVGIYVSLPVITEFLKERAGYRPGSGSSGGSGGAPVDRRYSPLIPGELGKADV